MIEVRFSKDGNDHIIEMMHQDYHCGICGIVSSEEELQKNNRAERCRALCLVKTRQAVFFGVFQATTVS